MMLTEFEKKVADFIAAERLLTAGEKVLLAVSGGADSTALLYVMAALRLDICCAHINHQLRGNDAQRDEDFVLEQCRFLKLPVVTGKIDVRNYAMESKQSVETAARKLRIDALLDIAAKQNCNCIATAHQKNDNAETVLQRLARGTGFRGLCGIWPAKQFSGGVRFIRPLLCASREEVIRYLNGRNLKWCTDRTNLDCGYRRNYIRHRLLPALQKDCSGNLVDELSGLAKTSRVFYRLIIKSADAVWSNVAKVDEREVILDSDRFAGMPQEVKIEIIRRVLSHLDAGEQDFTEEHYENLLSLPDVARLQLPGCIEVNRRGGAIVFGRPYEKPAQSNIAEPVKIPGNTAFSGMFIEAETFDYDEAGFKKFKANKNNFVEWFDFDKLKMPLEIRHRKKGEKFRPLGLKAEKKIGKFLTGIKAPQKLRRKVVLIADAEKIIWLCPVRISEQAKVVSRTKKVLQLKVCS